MIESISRSMSKRKLSLASPYLTRNLSNFQNRIRFDSSINIEKASCLVSSEDSIVNNLTKNKLNNSKLEAQNV